MRRLQPFFKRKIQKHITSKSETYLQNKIGKEDVKGPASIREDHILK